MRFFNRNYELDIIVPGETKTIKNLKIEFEIIKTARGIANRCDLRIYNLNDDSIQKLKEDQAKIILKCGYDDELFDIFIGQVKNVIVKKQGLDIVINVFSSSSDQSFKNSYVNKSYSKELSIEDIFKDVVNFFGSDVQQGEINVDEDLVQDHTGFSFSSKTVDVLDELCESNGLEWCLNDEKLDIFQKGKAIDAENITVFTSSTGLIGSPSINKIGVEFKCFLNPTIHPHNLVEVASDFVDGLNFGNLQVVKVPETLSTKAEGIYKVLEIIHKGDSTAGEWISEIKANRYYTNDSKKQEEITQEDLEQAQEENKTANADDKPPIEFNSSFKTTTAKITDKDTASFETVINKLIDKKLVNLHTALPAFISEFDTETQLATVQIAIKRILKNTDEKGEEALIDIDLPPLQNVPVIFPASNQFSFTIPIEIGDEVLLIFNERSIDNWFNTSKVSRQISNRRHSFSDAVALIGLKSSANKIENFDNENLEIKSNTSSIKLGKDGEINIDTIPPIDDDSEEDPAETRTLINISSKGEVSIECIGDDENKSNINFTADNINITAQTDDQSGSVNIITDNANVTAENIALNGTTNLDGDLTVTGAVKGATIESDANNLDDTQDQLDQHEIEYAAHMHTGNMGSPTSPPL